MTEIWTEFSRVFDPNALATRLSHFLPNLIVAALTLAAFYLVHRGIDQALRFFLRRSHIDLTATEFMRTLLRYTIFAIAGITALGQVGVDVSGLIASLGVAGLTLGFAARDALSNVISGIFIFWDRPFVIGDLVEIGSAYGRVDSITMRSTRVVTPDGRMLAVPNSTIVNSTVASYTNFPHLRLDVPVSIGLGESIPRVRALLLALVQGDKRFMAEPAPHVVVTALGDFNLTIELRVWLEDEKQHVRERLALREAMFVTLTENGIDMPYETINVTPLEVQQRRFKAA